MVIVTSDDLLAMVISVAVPSDVIILDIEVAISTCFQTTLKTLIRIAITAP